MRDRGLQSFAVLGLAFGLAACAAPGTAERALAGRTSTQCTDAAVDSTRAQYVVGYGSLMQDESRARTAPKAGPAHPVEIAGYRRGWFTRGSPTGFSTTFLGVIPNRQSRLNAVMYQVRPAELASTDSRERFYCRDLVEPSAVTRLDPGFSPPPDAQVWIYVSRASGAAPPSSDYPIVQSYVDIFLSGCLEQEQRFALAGFARRCIATTSDWSEHWVNDRLYPRRPFIYQPRAREIDALLSRELPRYFGRIRLER
jgi:hypothetical protein